MVLVWFDSRVVRLRFSVPSRKPCKKCGLVKMGAVIIFCIAPTLRSLTIIGFYLMSSRRNLSPPRSYQKNAFYEAYWNPCHMSCSVAVMVH